MFRDWYYNGEPISVNNIRSFTTHARRMDYRKDSVYTKTPDGKFKRNKRNGVAGEGGEHDPFELTGFLSQDGGLVEVDGKREPISAEGFAISTSSSLTVNDRSVLLYRSDDGINYNVVNNVGDISGASKYVIRIMQTERCRDDVKRRVTYMSPIDFTSIRRGDYVLEMDIIPGESGKNFHYHTGHRVENVAIVV